MSDVLTQLNGAVFIAPDGPGTPWYYLGDCSYADDLSLPKAASTPIFCYSARTGKFVKRGSSMEAPDNGTITISSLLERTANRLEQLQCSPTLYVAQTACGVKSDLKNADRVWPLISADIEAINYTNLSHYSDDGASEVSVDFAFDPDVQMMVRVDLTRQTTADTDTINDIDALALSVCAGEGCGSPANAGEIAWTAPDSAAGPALATPQITENYGSTWTNAAANPFAAGMSIMSAAMVDVSPTVRRVILGMEAPTGAQGMIAYSDDEGATWTTVNVGGAAAGHGSANYNTIFALDYYHVWLASAAGYIYFSSDGGASWTAQESGSIHVGDYMSIDFYDENYGVAVGAADVIAVTQDGGDTWSAATATSGGGDLLTCNISDSDVIWTGDDDGKLWRSDDFGDSWTQVTSFVGSGVGEVKHVEFVNPVTGFLVTNSAAPLGTIHRTKDGGYTWEALTTPTNSGLNGGSFWDANNGYVVGEANSGTGVILRVSPEM